MPLKAWLFENSYWGANEGQGLPLPGKKKWPDHGMRKLLLQKDGGSAQLDCSYCHQSQKLGTDHPCYLEQYSSCDVLVLRQILPRKRSNTMDVRDRNT